MEKTQNERLKTNYTDYGRKRSEEFNKTQRQRLKDGLKIIAVVGIGGAIYGYKLGRKGGYARGVKRGYFEAANRFASVIEDYTEELKKSREE